MICKTNSEESAGPRQEHVSSVQGGDALLEENPVRLYDAAPDGGFPSRF